MIVNLILTDIYKNPLFSHPAHPPNSIAPLIALLHPLHLPSYPLYHPILLLSHSCIFLPDFPPLIPRPNSPATHPTLIPTKPLLSNYQLSPHYFNSLPLFHPSLLAHFLPLSLPYLLPNFQFCSTFLTLLTQDSYTLLHQILPTLSTLSHSTLSP